MPRFVKIIWHDQSAWRNKHKNRTHENYYETRERRMRNSDSRFRYGSENWIRRGSDLTALPDAYQPLRSEQNASAVQSGIHRTVSIELTTEVSLR